MEYKYHKNLKFIFIIHFLYYLFFSFSQLLILQNRKKKWLENKISSTKILKKCGFNTT